MCSEESTMAVGKRLAMKVVAQKVINNSKVRPRAIRGSEAMGCRKALGRE